MSNQKQLDDRLNKKSQETLMGEHILYDFTLCYLPQFAHLRMEVHGGCLTERYANEFAFSSTVRDMFANCYNVNDKLEKNDLYSEEYPRFIYALMERYAYHIHQAYQSNPRDGIRLMFDWLLKTREIIEDNYQAIPTLYLASDIAIKKDLQNCQSKDTWPVKLKTYSLLYRYFRYRIDDLLPEMPDSLVNLIPYNMWIGEYDELKAKYTGKFGLEYQKRAVVDVEDNKKRFFEVLVDQCTTFCLQMTADNPLMSSDNIFQQCDGAMTALIHSYFRDYIERLQAQSNVATDIDAAILNWIVNTLHDMFETYAANQEKVLRKCGSNQVVDIAAMCFYLDICERNILEIAHVYFQDSERIPLVNSKEKTKENMEESVGPKHTRTIEYKTLYDAWNEKAFTRTTLQEFKDALDQADFRTMMERAKEAGTKAGYIGGIKYIMKLLKPCLGSDWYHIACGSIGESQNSVNKLNDGTKQIKKINVRILSSCIK